MKKFKGLIAKVPAIYFIIIITLYWIDTAVLFNPIAIIFIAMLSLYLIFENRYIGITFSSLILLINIYLIFSLVSEYKEFSISNEGLPMLVTGIALIITNIAAAIYIMTSAFSRAQSIHSHKIKL